MSEPGGSAGDGLVGGPKTPQQIAAQRRIQQTQAQVDEVVGIMRMNVEKVLERDQKISELDDRVVDIMRTNVEKVLERDTKLSELDDRADALQQGASQFEQQAGKLKRKYWWKNLKMMIIMGVIGLILIIIIGVWIHSSVGGGSDDSGSGGNKVEGVPTAQPLISLQQDAGSGSGAKGPDVLDKSDKTN